MFTEIPYIFDAVGYNYVICEGTNFNDNGSIVTINKELANQIDYMLFSLQIDSVTNRCYPKRDAVIVLNSTPKVLNDIGMPNLPITISQKHIYTIINHSGKYKNVNYHGLGSNIIKQIPNSIKEPLFVLRSKTRDDSVLVITKLKDKYYRPIVASIKISGKGRIKNIQIASNVMTSVYGRNNYNKFMDANIALGNILYDHKIGIIKKLDTADREQ